MTQTRRLLSSQPWIYSWLVDSILIIAPSFLAVAAVLFFREAFDQTMGVPLWAWVSFILCIDVAHVYGTIYRTYLNPVEFKENKTMLTIIPLLCWLGGVLLYSISGLLFWQVLAYVAVFHFIRQQYGFMMLYSRKETNRSFKWMDKSLVYLATLYPIVYWHTHLPRNFHWFVDGDFLAVMPKQMEWVVLSLYVVSIILYAAKEIIFFVKFRQFSLPKQLIIFGTALSWYAGIVLLNGDMAFTITNVVSHGLPYIGLIWIYGRKQVRARPDEAVVSKLKFKHLFSLRFVPLFIGSLLILAYLEEGLWNGFVWREHLSVFGLFSHFPKIADHSTLAWLVPLLSLPQVTHYVLDGFIWKLRDPNASWQKVVFPREVQLS